MGKRPAVLVLVACVLLWAAQGLTGELPPETTKAVWIVDDFEDQDLYGWSPTTGPCTASISPIGAAGTNYSLHIVNDCGHDGGTTHDLGGMQATGVSLYVKSTTIAVNHLYVILDDDNFATNGYLIGFLATSDNWFAALGGVSTRYDLELNDDLEWHQLQFSIDWIGKNVDVSIDGVPRQYNIPFQTDSIESLDRISLYNLQAANAWYDQILLSTPGVSTNIMLDGFESADESGWSSATPPLPQRLVIFAADGVTGAIGGRRGADVVCGQAAQGRAGVPLHATTRALISVDPMDTIANMPVRYGVPTGRKVTGPNQIPIADSWADLMDGTIDASLNAAAVLSNQIWYSGSDANGNLDPDNCSGWTDATGSAGRYGNSSSTSSAWISSGDSICGHSGIKLLCLAWR